MKQKKVARTFLLACIALLLGWNAPAAAQSCGEIGGDYCSQSGGCPGGFISLDQTYDCNPCCQEIQQGPSCGELGGNWCSHTGSCPSGYDSLGYTYDCVPCCRQRSQGRMSFSVYTGGSVSDAIVYANSTVIDNSWGCAHSSYVTNTTIRSPSGRTASGQGSGLQASASLAVNGEYGDYTIATNGSYYCSCSMMWAGYGGGQTLAVKQPASLQLVADNFYQTSCRYHRARDYQVRDQAGQPLQRRMYASESFTTPVNTCNVRFWEGGGSTNQAGRFRDNLYLCEVPICDQGGSCTVVKNQSWRIDGHPVTPAFTITYNCSTVTVH